MKVGTKSLLLGAHQFIIHPMCVYIAWRKLYKQFPDWRTAACIIFHDWGYWGSPEMDGEIGKHHPERGAKIALCLFGYEYYELCLYHSRHYADMNGVKPSKLCWADKLGVVLEPGWLYIPKAKLTGELKEYRWNAREYVPLDVSDWEWYKWIQKKFIQLVAKLDASVTDDSTYGKGK